MFNPFKKKEDNEFKLDHMELPTIGDKNNVGNENQVSEPNLAVPQLPEMNSSNDNLALSNQGTDLSSNPTMDLNSNPFANNSIGNHNNETDLSANNNLHSEISKTKIDSLDSKVTLIDARLSNMEQKLEMIFQMISNEVSEDTKRKFKVDSMMKNIK